MKEHVRFGVVGAGAIAQLAHLPVLSKMRGVELAAICDNDGPKARSLADRFGIPDAVTDIEHLLEDSELDAVVVATPNHLHEPHVLSAIAAGCDVLCERPLALTADGVERILAAAQRAGRKVLVANNHRFRSDVQEMARFIEGGELGKVVGIRAGAYHFKRTDEGWRQRHAESGGGAFFEHGFPLLDLALWLSDFPDPVRVSAQYDRAQASGSVEQSMFVMLECATGAACMFDVSTAYVGQEERWWFEVLASRGSARLAPLRVVKELNGRPMDVSPTGAAGRESPFAQSYRAQLAHVLAVIHGEAEYEAPTDQVTAHRVLEAAYAAAASGREVVLR